MTVFIITKYHFQRVVEAEQYKTLKRSLLLMSRGFSFSSAIKQSIEKASQSIQCHLIHSLNLVVFLQQKTSVDTFIKHSPFVEDLSMLFQSNSHTSDVLEAVIHKHETCLLFRRLSQKASNQARIQMVILSAIFFGLSVYYSTRYPNFLLSKLWISSFFLFFVGFMISFFLSRSFKWKI